jgi:Asp-tRNA(Asn)/Glu-tRNA(Gln) amidotransferase B subunit
LGKIAKVDLNNFSLIEKAIELAKLGNTCREVALALNIPMNRVLMLRKRSPELNDALEHWKEQATSNVERSLYERATGYDYFEEKEIVLPDGQVTKTILMKHAPPDVKAAQFWLTNRDRHNWKSNQVESEQGQKDMALEILEARKRLSKGRGKK